MGAGLGVSATRALQVTRTIVEVWRASCCPCRWTVAWTRCPQAQPVSTEQKNEIESTVEHTDSCSPGRRSQRTDPLGQENQKKRTAQRQASCSSARCSPGTAPADRTPRNRRHRDQVFGVSNPGETSRSHQLLCFPWILLSLGGIRPSHLRRTTGRTPSLRRATAA